MAGQVFWHRLAEEDLVEAHAYVGADSPVAAERLLEAVEETVRFLLANPSAGRLRGLRSPQAQGVRSLVVSGFPSHLIFYRSEGDDLAVVRVLHGARDLPRLLEDRP